MATLHELITKVIPLKGILRIPGYWMRKVLTAIADAVEAVNTELVSTSDKLALKDELLTKAIFYAKTGQPFFVLDKGTKMIVDGNVIQAEPYTVYKAKSLSFGRGTTSVDFLISLNIPAISFNGSSYLTSLDLSNFDTSAVKNMSNMFYNCTALTSLDLSSFDTSAVTSMDNMFYNCTALTSLDLSSFNTSAVTGISGMFYHCSYLTSLDLSNFDTSAVTSISYIFDSCSSLTTLDLSNFDISKVIYKDNMFYGCTALKNIKCKQAFKDWCVANASTIKLTVENITW